MNVIRRFLSYVEIKTKITSTFSFFLILAYLFYLKQPVHWPLTLIFFGSMFLFDLTTTAINNYIDTKTNGVPLQFSRPLAFGIIVVLFLLSTGLGILLAALTDLVVLLLGALCFLCGVLYTAGPVPISRQPLGELFSGLFYGLILTFILFYINLPAGELLTLQINAMQLTGSLNLSAFIPFLLVCAAPVCATANIMLANNICDVERDVKVNRYTLPYYLGKKALLLFAALYALPYLASLLLVLFGYLPPLYLLSLITAPVIFGNVSGFMKVQDKATTFGFAVQNFILMLSGNIIFIVVCALGS